MGGPVRPDKPVDAELSIVNRVSKIAPIAPILHLPAVFLGSGDNTLVHPIPDEATLERAGALSRRVIAAYVLLSVG